MNISFLSMVFFQLPAMESSGLSGVDLTLDTNMRRGKVKFQQKFLPTNLISNVEGTHFTFELKTYVLLTT